VLVAVCHVNVSVHVNVRFPSAKQIIVGCGKTEKCLVSPQYYLLERRDTRQTRQHVFWRSGFFPIINKINKLKVTKISDFLIAFFSIIALYLIFALYLFCRNGCFQTKSDEEIGDVSLEEASTSASKETND